MVNSTPSSGARGLRLAQRGPPSSSQNQIEDNPGSVLRKVGASPGKGGGVDVPDNLRDRDSSLKTDEIYDQIDRAVPGLWP